MVINGQEINVFACSSGTGKTYLADKDNRFVDLDREKYECKYLHLKKNLSNVEIEQLKDKVLVKNPEFPENFVKRIFQLLKNGKTLLVVPEPLIMDILKRYNLKYVLIYPSKDCKNEYKERLLKRGNSEEFIGWYDMFFDKYYNQNMADTDAVLKIEMAPGEYLEDVIKRLQ